MEEESRSWNNPSMEILHKITRCVPCKFDRVRMRLVCRSWCASLRLAPLLPPQLPWLLHPSPGGPTFSCLLCGTGEASVVHPVLVPADLCSGRFFGSYDGGWLFLAHGGPSGNVLLNLRTGRRIPLPDVVHSPRGRYCRLIMLAATLSSPPPRDTGSSRNRCFGAAIVHSTPYTYSRRHITFWLMGSDQAKPSIPADPEAEQSSSRSEFFEDQEMEDVIYDVGAFIFLSTSENILVCRLSLHQGALQVLKEWRRFLPLHHRWPTTARYLVESRARLLMVVKYRDILLPGLDPSTLPGESRSALPGSGRTTSWTFSVFELSHDAHDDGEPDFAWAWTPVPKLGGRMLFVGRGCSRSYEVADFPGFQEGIYFLDDEDSYRLHTIIHDKRYLCLNHGKWSAGPPPVVSRCFLPDQPMSNYSSQVWLLPMGEDTDSDNDSD